VRDITIDLNGFSIINTNGAGPASPVGIRISEATNIVIRNGQIEGFDRGIRGEGLFYGLVVENVHIHQCRRAGIEANGVVANLTQTMTIRNCVIEGMDATGEASSVGADGVTVLNCSVVVQNCVIHDVVGAGTGMGTCVDLVSATNSFVDNNLLQMPRSGPKLLAAERIAFFIATT
jgi:hypothetical protein